MKNVFPKIIFALMCVFAMNGKSAMAYEGRPERLMSQAHSAIEKGKLDAFGKAFGRAALCQWGTLEGLALLKASLPTSSKKMINEITLAQQGYLTKPRFAGFWAYYEQVYNLRVFDKSRTLLAEGKIECHFGLETAKRDADLNRPLDYYTVKSCRVIVFEARTFSQPPARRECSIFRQQL
mgnify:CR=1 FL=1